MTLPPEIWHVILEKVDDPIELIKLGAVCKHWYKVVTKIEKSTGWQQVCYHRMPYESYRRETTAKVYPRLIWDKENCIFDVEFEPDFWQKIVQSYCKWQLCLKLPATTDTVKDFPDFSVYEKITCIAVWGKY